MSPTEDRLHRQRAAALRLPRVGASAVELAICLPLVLTIVLGAMEASSVIFLKQSLTSAAYEAAQVASTQGGTGDEAKARAQGVLTTFQVNGAVVTISPAVTAQTEAGTTIVVSVSAPLSENCNLLRFFDRQGVSTASVTMTRL